MQPFKIECEVYDTARGSRFALTLWSLDTWPAVMDKAAEKFHLYPTGLHLQYRFSNEKPTTLPFDLNSKQAFHDLWDKYKQLQILPSITKSGRKSTRKTILVQLYNKNAEGESTLKGKGKVSKSLLALMETQTNSVCRQLGELQPPPVLRHPCSRLTRFMGRRRRLLQGSRKFGLASSTLFPISQSCAGGNAMATAIL